MVVFLNYQRDTMTIVFENVDEEIQFATWGVKFSKQEHGKILYTTIHKNYYH